MLRLGDKFQHLGEWREMHQLKNSVRKSEEESVGEAPTSSAACAHTSAHGPTPTCRFTRQPLGSLSWQHICTVVFCSLFPLLEGGEGVLGFYLGAPILLTAHQSTFLLHCQLFLFSLWHPAALFLLELWQTGLFPTSGIFVSCSSLTMSRAAPLHADYQACFLWLVFPVPQIFELFWPIFHAYFCSKEQATFF